MGEVKKIKLDDIIPCPFIPERVDLGEFLEMQGLADTIKIRRDVENPIKVRPSKTKPGKYERIWGKRRQEACSIADLKEVTCIVEDIDDDEAFRQSAIENIHRKDLNPIEEAKFFEAWSKHCNLNYNEIAGELGLRDPSYVYNRTSLLGLPEIIQDQILTGKNFGVHHGLLLLQVKDPSLQEKLANEVIEKNLTVRELEKKVKEIVAPKGESKPSVVTPKEQTTPEVKEEPGGIVPRGTITTGPEERAKELAREALKRGRETRPYEDLLKENEALRGKLEEVQCFLDKIAGEYDSNCPFCRRAVCISVAPDPSDMTLKVSLNMFRRG